MLTTNNFSDLTKINSQKITVNACKYNGTLHRSWKCDLIEENNDLWVFLGVFETEIQHPLLGVIRPGTISFEYYWKNHWYNVFRFHEPEGKLRNYYCNVNMPPKLINNNLSYIDLDIDVLVLPDFSYQILDLEEFEENSLKFNYSPLVIQKSFESMNKLISLIENKSFPFDFKF